MIWFAGAVKAREGPDSKGLCMGSPLGQATNQRAGERLGGVVCEVEGEEMRWQVVKPFSFVSVMCVEVLEMMTVVPATTTLLVTSA